jgi:hypothetical protein
MAVIVPKGTRLKDMNQLYTEYLIGFALKERHNQAAQWEQLRAARAGNPERGEGLRTFARLFRITLPQPGGSTLIHTAATEPQRATPC